MRSLVRARQQQLLELQQAAARTGARALSTKVSLPVPDVSPGGIVPRLRMPEMVPSGTGGRHSRSGQTVAVFGATGLMGGFVVSELGRHGTNMVVATRGDDMSWRHLKTCADYGKIVPSYININDEKSVRDTMKSCDTVINLMGKHYETKHFAPSLINCSFEDVHVRGAETVARIAREENIKHLVHVSTAYASKDSASKFARTKAEGEERVLKEFPGAVIVRPNVCYADQDQFLIPYATFAKMSPVIPVLDGFQAKLAPAYMGDVGTAIATIASNYSTAGSTFNLSGKNQYTLKQVFEYIIEEIGLRPQPRLVDFPVSAAKTIGRVINNLPNPYLTEDQVTLMLEDCPVPSSDEKTFDDVGMSKVADFETMAYNFLFRFREGGHFMEADSKPRA